jgi:Replicative DNA helicase
MKKLSVSEYLHRKGFQYKRRGEEALLQCPFCPEVDREKKFSINLSSGLFQCFHKNKCGVSGSFYEFQVRLGDKPVSNKEKDVFANPPKKKAFVKPNVKMEPPTNAVIEYLHNRGLTDETIKYFKFGSEKGDAVSFPYYRNGELVNVKYRGIKEKKFWGIKDAELILFNRDNIEKDNLTICEGEFDCAALHQYGIESVSVPAGAGNSQWLESEWDYLETFQAIYLCYDNDSAGQQGARDLAVKLGEWRCKLVTLPFKDANECIIKKVPIETIISCFTNAADFIPDTLVTPLYFAEQIQELFRKGTQMFGTQTPWGKLDAILKGWRDGELTIWSGRNGAGKSTILNQIFIDLAVKGVRSCIYSGEMSPARYLRWAVIQHQENNAPAPVKIQSSLDWMSGRIYILNITSGIEPEKLVSDFEYAARRYGVKHFIIDSLMKISFKGQDEFRQQHDFINRVVSFAQKQNVHVHVVAHPRKTESDDDTPGKVDIKGSSHITDLADNVIVLHRQSAEQKAKVLKNNKVPADTKLFVKKNREFGIEGMVNLTFDEQTKRFDD